MESDSSTDPEAAPGREAQRRLWRLGYRAALLALAALVLGSFVGVRMDGYERAGFADALEGRAHRPFAYRALAPAVMRGVRALVPESVRAAADRWYAEHRAGSRLLRKLGRKVDFERARFSDFAVAAAVLYAAILGFAWALRRLARALYRTEPGFLDALTLFAVAGLPAFFRYYSHLYDLPHLFLFTLCLALVAERRLGLYLAAFALTSASKETALLLVLVFALARREELPPRRLAVLVAAQIAIFAAVRAALLWTFRDNPGGLVERHLEHNLFLPPWGFAEATALGLVAVAVARDWSAKPALLRHALWILVPLLGLGAIWGYLDEYRIYYEVYPVVLLLVAPTAAALVRPGRPPLAPLAST